MKNNLHSHNLYLLLVLLGFSLTLLVEICQAQNTPQDFLDHHNHARSKLGIHPLTWDHNVAAYARTFANERAASDCELVHSGGPYGENLFWGGGPGFTAADAVNLWVSEQHNYDHVSNTCRDGQQCLHYTQVMWRDSLRLGCALAQCGNGATIISCNYDPPGNFIGERPY